MNDTNKSKVCPSCGGSPPTESGPFCTDCGDKFVARTELPRDIWKDPAVKERLKEGVPAYDIALLRCPECNQLGYYNEGSSFTCRFCDESYRVDGDEWEPISLAESVTETTDGYDNRTL